MKAILFSFIFCQAMIISFHVPINKYKLSIDRVFSESKQSLTRFQQQKDVMLLASTTGATGEKLNTTEKSLSKTIQRATKFVLFSALLGRAFMIESLIDYSKLGKYALASILACSCGIRRIEDCYSYGYGGSLLLIGLMNGYDLLYKFYEIISVNYNWYNFLNPKNIFQILQNYNKNVQIIIVACLLQAVAYCLYGIRMITFIHKRNNSLSYQNSERFKRFQSMEKKIDISKRLSVWLSTALLLGLFYSLPIHLNIASSTQILPMLISKSTENFNPLSYIVSIIASFSAIMAVAFQYAADNQKLQYKEESYKVKNTQKDILPFCTSGLFKIWRHPNYLAEFFYHVSILIGSIAPLAMKQFGFPFSWSSIVLSLPGPTIFASIILAATRVLEKRQKEEYSEGKDKEVATAYNNWVKSTRRFF